jgi:hypothetical protein
MFPALGSLTGGGGLSASSSASTGPLKGGDVGGSSFNFGGINTGAQNTLPGWVWAVGAAAVAVVAVVMLRKK